MSAIHDCDTSVGLQGGNGSGKLDSHLAHLVDHLLDLFFVHSPHASLVICEDLQTGAAVNACYHRPDWLCWQVRDVTGMHAYTLRLSVHTCTA